jgi:outer membrane biogenesis lipoprotein LolB
MKKSFIFLSIIGMLVLSAGCSSTWDGAKKDTSNAWKSTKKVVHDATE